MRDLQIVREGLQLLVDTMQGAPARRLPSAGRFSAKLGGPQALTAMFAAVSPDAEAAARFRERHENGMRAEVFATVSRLLDRWDHDCKPPECDQSHFDDLFVALVHLRLFVRPRRGEPQIAPIAHYLAELTMNVQNTLAEKWFMPLISARLNADDGPPADPEFRASVRSALG